MITKSEKHTYDLLSIVILPLSILAASALFLWPSPSESPMDDTYIHLVYAGNLSEHGKLFFNNPGEIGVGTSSILWTLILAGGKSLGLSMHWVANGKLDRYSVSNEVTCLILPGRTGKTTDGWFDFAEELGLTNSTMFTMQQESVFQIDRERWLVGYLPVNNSQATVTVYRPVHNE